MLASSLQYKPISDDDLRRSGDENGIEMTKLLMQRDAVVRELVGLINSCMTKKQEGWLQILRDTVNSSAYQEVKNGKEELLVLERVCRLAEQEERDKRQSILLKVSSIGEVCSQNLGEPGESYE